MKQISVRPTLEEYQAFERWRQTNEGLAESAALCELLRRFFEEGHKRDPRYRIAKISKELDALLSQKK